MIKKLRSTGANFEFKKSFTLIEILVVVTIISVLIGTVAISYSSLTKSSRDARRRTDLEQMRAALEMYRSAESATGEYPSFAEADCSGLSSVANFSSYLPFIPSDPKQGSNYSCDVSVNSFSLKASLEVGTYADCGGNCGATTPCEYAVGPYGKLCGP